MRTRIQYNNKQLFHNMTGTEPQVPKGAIDASRSIIVQFILRLLLRGARAEERRFGYELGRGGRVHGQYSRVVLRHGVLRGKESSYNLRSN